MNILRIAYKLQPILWFFLRPVSLGVRALMVEDGNVVLVRHTYQDQWYLPGGGVKRNETLEQAIRRELEEEVSAEIGHIELFGTYSTFYHHRSDHVVLFVSNDFTLGVSDSPEIAAVERFPLTSVPANTSPGTKRRVAEFRTGSPPIVACW